MMQIHALANNMDTLKLTSGALVDYINSVKEMSSEEAGPDLQNFSIHPLLM